MEKNFLILIVMFFLSSCSLWNGVKKRENLIIDADPVKTKVYSESGDLIGETPLELTPEQVDKIKSGEFCKFLLRNEGFIDLNVVVNTKEMTNASFKMEKLKTDHFEKWVFGSYNTDLNVYSKDLLNLQMLMMVKKYEDARNKIMEFQKKYPNVGATFTMLAHIEIQEKKFEKAKLYLEKAIQIDAKDSTAIRMLNIVNGFIKGNG